MNKKHSELEMFLRKFMQTLGLGYQCYYKNRAKNNHRQGHPGHWSIDIWDQRPEHYSKATKKDVTHWQWYLEHKEPRKWHGNIMLYDDSPTQKWYTNQHTDADIEIVGPEVEVGKSGKDYKDDFLKWLLFEHDMFKDICNGIDKIYADGPTCIMYNAIAGKPIDKIDKMFDEYQKMKEKYAR